MGKLAILNVGAGDIKFSFDTSNASEAIRAKRMITDMLRRGYALLIEIDGVYQRAIEFKEDVGEYVIADYDPQPEQTTKKEIKYAESETSAEAPQISSKKRGRKSIPMEKANAVAVGRSAGG